MIILKKYIFTIVAVMILIASVTLQKFWYPGITKKQTIDILLSDQKFGVRAFDKAVWHGDSIFDDIALLTNQFENINYYQAKVISRLISNLEIIDVNVYGKTLYNNNKLYPKLFGLLILSRSNKKINHKDDYLFLKNIAVRNYPGLDKNLLKARDYYSEIAIIAIGNYGDDGAFQFLKSIINEDSVPYTRHVAAITALVSLNDKRAIEILHSRIIDENFNATLPAFQALLALGDSDAIVYAERRLAMKIGGDNLLLKQAIYK